MPVIGSLLGVILNRYCDIGPNTWEFWAITALVCGAYLIGYFS